MATTQYVITARMASDQLGSDLNKVERQIVASVTRIGGALRDIGTTAAGFAGAQLGLQGLGAAFEAAKAGVIDFNSTMDAAQRSFTFLMGSADEARKHIAELSAVAENTPFRSEDFLAASRILQGLGANAAAIPGVLKKIADAAVVAQVPLTTATEAIGRFLSGVSATGGTNAGQGIRQLASQGLISDKLRASLTAMAETGATSQQIIEKFISSLGKFDVAAEQASQGFQGLMVKIKDQAQETAGTAFEPFFRVFEQLGKSFLASMKDPEMQKSVQALADVMLDIVKNIALGMAVIIEDVKATIAAAQNVIDFLQPIIDANKKLVDAEGSLLAKIGIKPGIQPTGTPRDGDVLGPPTPNIVEKTRALFDLAKANTDVARSLREQAKAQVEAAQSAPAGPLFDKAKPTQEMERALEEAQRIVLGLSLQFTASEKAGLELQQRFEALAKTAGPLGAQVKALALSAQNLTEAKAGLDTINAASEAFRQSLPVYSQTEKAIEDVQAKFTALARGGPDRVKDQVLALIPVVLSAKEAFKSFSENMGIAVAQAETFALIGENTAAAFKPAADAIDAFRKSIAQAIVDEKALSIAAAATNATPLLASQAFGQGLQSQLENQIQLQAGFLAAFEETRRVGLGTEEQMKSLDNTIEDVRNRIAILTGQLAAVKAQNPFTQLALSLAMINKQATAFGDAVSVIGSKIAATETAINALIAQGIALDDERIQGLIRALDQLKIQQKIIVASGNIVGQSLTTISDTMVDAFANGTVAAIKWGDVVKQVLSDIVKELIRVFIIQTAVKAVGNIALGAFGGGGDVGGLDAGGIVTRPGVFHVAETGPEAVIPLDKFDFGGGRGGDVTVNIHPPEGTESSSQESTGPKGSRTIDVFITKVVNKAIDQGSFDRSMGGAFGLTRQGSRR